MINLIAFVAGCVVTVPVLASIIIYLSALKVYRNTWKAVHFTANWTTMLYIFSVAALLTVITGRPYFWLIGILLIVLLAISVIIQWKIKEEIVFRYAWKGFWRFTFLLFNMLYIGLVIYGILTRIINT